MKYLFVLFFVLSQIPSAIAERYITSACVGVYELVDQEDGRAVLKSDTPYGGEIKASYAVSKDERGFWFRRTWQLAEGNAPAEIFWDGVSRESFDCSQLHWELLPEKTCP
jgi:hypothetical protein